MTARIVIVDDRTTNLRIYSQFVKMMGPDYSSECFHSPVEALDWLENNQADIIVVDYRMPEMNGAEFIDLQRSKSNGSQIPAIMITAQQDRGCRIAALDAGATDFLQSPVTHVEFRDRIKLLLAQHNKAKQLEVHSDANNNGGKIIDPTAAPQNSKTLLEQIIDTTPVLLNVTDRNGKVLFINAQQAALLGDNSENLIGRMVYDVLETKLADRERQRNLQIVDQGITLSSFEERYISDGIELTYHCNKSPLTNQDGQTIGVLTSAIDITARKFAEEHRTHLALHDMLTGLPNRALLSERMRTTIDECQVDGQNAALLLLDLDRFKVINDTRGHQAGDQLLRQVAERINNAMQPGDCAARIGGDEFAIILRNVDNVEEIAASCENLLQAIGQHYSIDGIDQIIGGSIGVARIPADGTDPDELLRLADLAMYEAKSQGRNRSHFFSPQLNAIAQSNATLENELRTALEKNQFILEYQPIVDASDNRFCGLEALVRWNHPERGRLLPNEFLRVANDSGLIDEMGNQIIETACKEIAAFQAQGIELPTIAVNVSPRQFHAMGMSETILSNISKFEVPSGNLAIEITEELLLDQNQQILEELDTLRNHGIGIYIDDFGTGYSSLQYLRDLPATKLKIDQTFISRIENSAADRAIISTIAHLSHALDMRVVAEGVENSAQFDLLRASGCDELQGYYFGQPLTSAQLHELFERNDIYFQANG